jgi:hypothetical protein
MDFKNINTWLLHRENNLFSTIMLTIEERRALVIKNLDDFKKSLEKFTPAEWEKLTEFIKENTIGAACIVIHLCDCLTNITKQFVEDIFRENGGWGAEHPFTTGVVQRLREWRCLN